MHLPMSNKLSEMMRDERRALVGDDHLRLDGRDEAHALRQVGNEGCKSGGGDLFCRAVARESASIAAASIDGTTVARVLVAI